MVAVAWQQWEIDIARLSCALAERNCGARGSESQARAEDERANRTRGVIAIISHDCASFVPQLTLAALFPNIFFLFLFFPFSSTSGMPRASQRRPRWKHGSPIAQISGMVK